VAKRETRSALVMLFSSINCSLINSGPTGALNLTALTACAARVPSAASLAPASAELEALGSTVIKPIGAPMLTVYNVSVLLNFSHVPCVWVIQIYGRNAHDERMYRPVLYPVGAIAIACKLVTHDSGKMVNNAMRRPNDNNIANM
jgi:hypothetical protein